MIQMSNVVKRFGDKEVLSEVTFTARGGEIFGLLGPSGAGKTTIINILTNQLDACAGEFQVAARPDETGLLLDEDGLYPRLNCVENLEVFATIYGISRDRVFTVLQQVGLAEAAKTKVSDLSKGMRQRLAIARAILHHPTVLFLDEPTSALDPATAKGVHALIRDIRDRGATIFLTTHNMDEATKLCDHVALLHAGRIVEQGAPAEICDRYNAVKTVPDLESVFLQVTNSTSYQNA